MKHFTKHLPHYISLIGILVVGALGFTYFYYDRAFQMAIAVGMAGAYISWGIIHHHLHRDLHLSVVVEYVLISALGLLIILSLLARA